MNVRLRLRQSDLQRMEAHARTALPRECCGVILGEKTDMEWRASGIEESANLAPVTCTDRFEVDPALLLRLQKASRAGGPRMIGVYHSHPNGLAAPSQADLELSWQTGFLWLITAIDGRGMETRAFLRAETEFIPVTLLMQDESA